MKNGPFTRGAVWYVPLRDVATVIMGQSPPSSTYTANGEGLPFFQGKAEFGTIHPTPVKWCVAPTKIAEPGDVLMSVRAPVGPTNLAIERCCIGRGLAAIRPMPELRSKWLLYAFRAMERGIDNLGTGTTFKAISGQTLRQLEVPIADIEQQDRAIADVEKQFSRLDEAVASLERAKVTLKRYKGAVLEAAVEGRLLVSSSRASSSPGSLPAGWQWLTVGDLARVGTGATPSRSNSTYWEDGDIPWVTSAAVNEPYVDRATQYVTRTALAETNLTIYPPGTLLVAMYGEGKTRGKCTELRIAAATNQALAALQADPSVRPYLKLVLDHSYEKLRKVASGGVQPNLNLSLVRALRVPLPPIEEQSRIVAEVDRRLSIVREVETEVVANLKRAQALRQAILSKAFAGCGERGE